MALTALLLLALLPAPDTADEGNDADEIPTVGRPDRFPFSEASGDFKVQTAAEPTAVAVEQPLTFTLTVRATGKVKVRKPPRRIDLRAVPAFDDNFYIEDLPDPPRARAAADVWVFRYGLKPRSTEVREVPGLPFVFYRPDIPFPERRFQTIYTEPIPLQVRPAEKVAVSLQAPEAIFHLAVGAGLLAHQEPWRPPGLLGSALLLGLPLLGCLGWYLGWQRLYPDAARLARHRRSRAALRALELLRPAARQPAPAAAALSTRAVVQYLRQRLDLPIVEPTPAETARHLGQLAFPPTLVEQAELLLRSCDAVRYGPRVATGPTHLPDDAARLILALEAQSWCWQPS
jgi:hypothetical protein